jgi:hypothetical protein
MRVGIFINTSLAQRDLPLVKKSEMMKSTGSYNQLSPLLPPSATLGGMNDPFDYLKSL